MSSIVSTFVEECEDLLSSVEEATLGLRDGRPDAEAIGLLFRVFHTIKGSSAMVGLDRVSAFTHRVETVLDRVRGGQLGVSRELVSVVLGAKDHLAGLVSGSSDQGTHEVEAELVARLSALVGSEPRASSPRDTRRWTVRVSPRPGRRLAPEALTGLRADLERLGPVEIDETPGLDSDRSGPVFVFRLLASSSTAELRDRATFVASDADVEIESEPFFGDPHGEVVLFDELIESSAPPDPRPPSAASPERLVRGPTETMVRVSARKLDALVGMVGELVIAQARISQLTEQLRDPTLAASVEALERLVVDLRDGALGVQMMPIGSTFGRFRRLVHDLALKLDKKVELVTDGADTELDKSVLDRLVDPLLHLVRNAVDHGIEREDVRRERGKAPAGTVRLSARHEGQFVVITIADDGNGLDPEAIRRKAIERGLLDPAQVWTPAELYSLIFLPGFSTAQTVSDVSGRGVGMDVVKRQLDELRGVVTISSEPGRGAALSLRLPLTLAIIDGLLVEAGHTRYVVPLAAVTEAVDLPPGDRARFNGRRAVEVRGTLVPYVSLRDAFGATGAPPPHERVVLIEHGRDRVGLVVDRVLGQRQTVIQTLGRLYRDIKVVGGATILGDGEVALILDLEGVVDLARRPAVRERERRSAA